MAVDNILSVPATDAAVAQDQQQQDLVAIQQHQQQDFHLQQPKHPWEVNVHTHDENDAVEGHHAQLVSGYELGNAMTSYGPGLAESVVGGYDAHTFANDHVVAAQGYEQLVTAVAAEPLSQHKELWSVIPSKLARDSTEQHEQDPFDGAAIVDAVSKQQGPINVQMSGAEREAFLNQAAVVAATLTGQDHVKQEVLATAQAEDHTAQERLPSMKVLLEGCTAINASVLTASEAQKLSDITNAKASPLPFPTETESSLARPQDQAQVVSSPVKAEFQSQQGQKRRLDDSEYEEQQLDTSSVMDPAGGQYHPYQDFHSAHFDQRHIAPSDYLVQHQYDHDHDYLYASDSYSSPNHAQHNILSTSRVHHQQQQHRYMQQQHQHKAYDQQQQNNVHQHGSHSPSPYGMHNHQDSMLGSITAALTPSAPPPFLRDSSPSASASMASIDSMHPFLHNQQNFLSPPHLPTPHASFPTLPEFHNYHMDPSAAAILGNGQYAFDPRMQQFFTPSGSLTELMQTAHPIEIPTERPTKPASKRQRNSKTKSSNTSSSATAQSANNQPLSPTSPSASQDLFPSTEGSGSPTSTRSPTRPQRDPTPRRYACVHCPKRFTRPSTLKTHMNSHTGERPFACENAGCGWKFTVLSNLKRHMRVCRGGATGCASGEEGLKADLNDLEGYRALEREVGGMEAHVGVEGAIGGMIEDPETSQVGQHTSVELYSFRYYSERSRTEMIESRVEMERVNTDGTMLEMRVEAVMETETETDTEQSRLTSNATASDGKVHITKKAVTSSKIESTVSSFVHVAAHSQDSTSPPTESHALPTPPAPTTSSSSKSPHVPPKPHTESLGQQQHGSNTDANIQVNWKALGLLANTDLMTYESMEELLESEPVLLMGGGVGPTVAWESVGLAANTKRMKDGDNGHAAPVNADKDPDWSESMSLSPPSSDDGRGGLGDDDIEDLDNPLSTYHHDTWNESKAMIKRSPTSSPNVTASFEALHISSYESSEATNSTIDHAPAFNTSPLSPKRPARTPSHAHHHSQGAILKERERKLRQGRLLLVSLLEDFCFLYDQSPAKNTRLFFLLCKQLSAMGIIDSDDFLDEVSAVRGSYKRAFRDLVVQAMQAIREEQSGIRGLPSPLGVDGSEGGEQSMALVVSQASYPAGTIMSQYPYTLPYTSLPITHPTASTSPPYLTPKATTAYTPSQKPPRDFSEILDLHSSRYHEDFSELHPLGKGAFGQVMCVKNRLDGVRYAVKRIRLGRSGEGGLEKILREVKVQARLTHVNVVRYYSCWFEHFEPHHHHHHHHHHHNNTSGFNAKYEEETNTAGMYSTNSYIDDEATREPTFSVEKSQTGEKFLEDSVDMNSASETETSTSELSSDDSYEEDEYEEEEEDDDESGIIFDRTPSTSSTSPVRITTNAIPIAKTAGAARTGSLSSNDKGGSVESISLHTVTSGGGYFEAGVRVGSFGSTRSLGKEKKGRVGAEGNEGARLVKELTLFIQMELCGPTLQSYLYTRNAVLHNLQPPQDPMSRLSPTLNLRILRDLCKGLSYIHSQGCIHRDIAPKNLFWVPEGGVATKKGFEGFGGLTDGVVGDFGGGVWKIGDFGLVTLEETKNVVDPSVWDPAKHGSESNGPPSTETSSSTTAVGTITYASPEQLSSSKLSTPLTSKSDIYSLGILLYELFMPFNTFMERATKMRLLRKGELGEAFVKKWPKEATVVLWCMNEDACMRPSAGEVLELEMVKGLDDKVLGASLDRGVVESTLSQQLDTAYQQDSVVLEQQKKDNNDDDDKNALVERAERAERECVRLRDENGRLRAQLER
ncbi:Eukaryotic translation initiation factor 2-alpha kinase [Chytridiales sp. JEL 0842]|nr:Eukaryotic translation initiation factor 2-alpha kinase [Chytridiales sp. JEL 0842]